MKKILTFLLLIFVNHLSAQSVYENNSILIWNQNRPLTWEDFKSEKYPTSALNAAGIAQRIVFRPKELSMNNVDEIKVIPLQYKYDSWVLVKSNDLLQHEQIHFDINELYARKIRKEIKTYLEGCYNCKLTLIAEIYYNLTEEASSLQAKYDEEIRKDWHDEKQHQNIWNKKIDSLLQIYNDYKIEILIDEVED